jgi:hypothetical protein
MLTGFHKGNNSSGRENPAILAAVLQVEPHGLTAVVPFFLRFAESGRNPAQNAIHLRLYRRGVLMAG